MRERVSARRDAEQAQPSRTTVHGQPGAGPAGQTPRKGGSGSGPVQWEGARWSCRARGSADQTWAGLGGILARL